MSSARYLDGLIDRSVFTQHSADIASRHTGGGFDSNDAGGPRSAEGSSGAPAPHERFAWARATDSRRDGP